MNKLTGKCLCAAIAYEITGPLGPIVNCHCSMCRRWHGAAYRTRCTVAASQFKWTKGEAMLAQYDSSANVIKTFCKQCGSNLISLYKNDPEHIGLPIGGLEQDPGTRPIAHIYVDDKSPWYEITDQLPVYHGLPSHDIDSVLHAREKE